MNSFLDKSGRNHIDNFHLDVLQNYYSTIQWIGEIIKLLKLDQISGESP